ncbi:MAG: hypothetical protein J6M34_01930 [Clostridia bacterium]|nr:hypothetical protein [Clostridia bacterium]
MKALYQAWDTAFSRFFCPETELFYEFIPEGEPSAWSHVPSVDDIRKNVPNPCGWGTGMEDSTLNGGSALDAVICAYEITKDPKLKPIADKLFRGLLRCAMPHGFIARSVSPTDGKSHYAESSRDQYTHWVFGALRLYDSPLCDTKQKEEIKRVLTEIAVRCEGNTDENGDCFLRREDGSVGKVGKLWGAVSVHEWFRLPMFYLAAYHVTKNPHWKALYLRYRDEAFSKSLAPIPEHYKCYAILQMQYSLRAAYDCEEDPIFKGKLLARIQTLAEIGEQKSLASAEKFRSGAFWDTLYYPFRRWDRIEPLCREVFNGYRYENPAQSERKENAAFYPVRAVGEGACIAALCPGYPISDEIFDALLFLANAFNFSQYSNVYALLLLPCGYVTCLKTRREQASDA